MDLDALKAELKVAQDAEHRALAGSIGARADDQQLIEVARWLMDPDARVRTAAIAALEVAKFRPAVGALCAVAKARSGHERLLALGAIAIIADTRDSAKVAPLFELPVADDDERAAIERLRVVVEHAKPEVTANTFGLLSNNQATRREALVRVLKNDVDPAITLSTSILETDNAAIQMDLLGGLGTLGARPLLRAAEQLLKSADDDLIALIARKLAQKLSAEDPELRAHAAGLLAKVERRVASVVTKGALDSSRLSLHPEGALDDKAAVVNALDEEGLSELAVAFRASSLEARAKALPALVEGLEKRPTRVAVFAASLGEVLAHIPVALRSRLSVILIRASRSSAKGNQDDEANFARAQADVARLCAKLLMPGTPLPRELVMGLSLSSADDDRVALVELLSALATEESAHELLKLKDDPSPAVKERALVALAEFQSQEAKVLEHPGARFEVITRYKDPHNQDLVPDGRHLKDPNGRRYVLSERGPVLESETPWGGCVCCYRPRALEGAHPSCPITGQRHLIDDAGPILEEGHPLGACPKCDAVRPLDKEQLGSSERIICRACHTRFQLRAGKLEPIKRIQADPRPGELMTEARDNALPEMSDNMAPPSLASLEKQPPEVQSAMRATVLLHGKGSFRMWGGTGVCVGNDGSTIAVLTVRHNVEETRFGTNGQPVPLTCTTITGERAPCTHVWSARHGLDLALVTVKLTRTDEIFPLSLEVDEDEETKLGDPLFAVGHELSCAWSFYQGSVSAMRELKTPQGLKVEFLQTPMVLPSGLGGAGLFHQGSGARGGKLAGIISWFRHAGTTDTNFAISLQSVRRALRKERVKFAGGRLV